MKRSHRFLVALAAVMVLVWLLVRERGDPHVDAQPTTASAVTPSELVDVHAPEAVDAAIQSELRVEVEAADSTSPTPATNAFPTAAWGRLVVVDEFGHEAAAPDGVLIVESPGWSRDSRPSRLEVRGGAWRMDVHEVWETSGRQLHFTAAVVDQRTMRIAAPTAPVLFVEARNLEVRAQRPARSLLRVVDAATKLDLPSVALVLPEPYAVDPHPGLELESRVSFRGLASPIDIDRLPQAANKQTLQLFVGADQRAWTLLELDLVRGGERVVELAPGADLVLSVTGVSPESDSTLRIRLARTDGKVYECALERDCTLEFFGLPTEPLSLCAEVGSGDVLKALTLGELAVDLAPATTTRAELVLSAAPVYATAPLRGTLYAPVDWVLSEPILTFRSLDGAHVDREPDGVRADCSHCPSDLVGFDAFSFNVDAAPVGPGEWLVWSRLDPDFRVNWDLPDFSGVIAVPRAGLENLHLVLPGPVELEFDVRDSETGERVADADVGWRRARPSGVDDIELHWGKSSEEGLYRIRAPSGEVELMVRSDNYEPYRESLRVAPGAPRRIVRLKRPCSIEVKLRASRSALPAPRRWSATPTAIGGNGEVLSEVSREDALVLMVSAPGTYDISPDPIPGYRTPAPQRVEVQRGSPVSIEFVYEVERP